MIAKKFVIPLRNKKQVAKDTYSFYFDRTLIPHYDFFPGQYNRVTVPIVAADGKGASRFFTIASSPLQKDILMVTTKEGISDFKKKLFSLGEKETITFLGPMGGFYLDEDDQTERVFLAGGIGITPFHSMILYVAKKGLSIPITLLVSFSTADEMIYYDELINIAKQSKKIKIIYTPTHPELSSQKWYGETGRISERLINKYVLDISKPIYYIVGPTPMVEGTEELLTTMGIAEEKVRVEQFTGY